jgi:hypothetical protein
MNKLDRADKLAKLRRRRIILRLAGGDRRFKTKAEAQKAKKPLEKECGFRLRIAEMADIFI